MKLRKKVFVVLTLFAALSAGSWAEDSGSKPANNNASAAAAPAPPITAADVQALKDALAAQQKQIEQLTQQLQAQQAWQQQHSGAATPLNASPVITPVNSGTVATVNSDSSQPAAPQMAEVTTPPITVQQENPSGGLNLEQTQAAPDTNPMHGPVSIHFRGITISPGGFVAAEFVRRSRALGADLTTPFNSLTMPGASQSQMSEFFGSARQSRPTIYVDGRLKNVELSAYVSGDFLGAGTTSTATQTNSYLFRLRQAWGQAKFDNGWSFLGGQMWSLVTENKAGIAPSDDVGRTNDARPMTIDPQYNVGFTFARQYGIRLTKTFGHTFAAAVAMENAEGTLTTHNNIDNFLLGSEGASNSYNSAISGCTLSNYTLTTSTTPTYYVSCTPLGTYTFNPSPDLIAKVAFDPGFGHYEIFGLYDRFRDRVFPCENFPLTGPFTACPNDAAKTGPSAVGAYNVSKNGGAVGATARWTFYDKHIVFGLKGFAGEGIGRYGAANLSDMSIHADGTPNLIKNFQGLATLEWHGKKLDIYLYTGEEYAKRAYDFDAATNKYVGYGAPEFNNSGCYTEAAPTLALTNGFNPGSLSDCTSDTRSIIEGTAGFWYRFYNGPRGRFQFGTQYSYITRQTWSGIGPAGSKAPGVSPEGIEGEVFTSFRYYLP
jgi:hypothetical protein